MTAADAFEPVRPVRVRAPARLNWAVLLGVALVAVAGLAGYVLLASSSPAPARPALRDHQALGRPGNQAPQPAGSASAGSRASPAASTPASPASPAPAASAAPARPLVPVSATAFGPGGAGQGDNTEIARFAIDRSAATAWHTDWYTSAHFGNLQRGTGLLLNMGRQVTITSARIALARGAGAAMQLRAGNETVLARLRPVAGRAPADGVVSLRFVHPVHARYLLIWFTRLPRGPAGTFEEHIRDVRLSGHG
jgi:hypothetical protein